MSSFVKAARREQEVKWAWIWFKQFSSFHRHRGESTWEFSASHVVQFLQSKRDASVPAWKRMRIIEGLITFRGEIQRRSSEDLVQPLERWVASREVLHQHDLAEGTASVWLPYALSRKYPTAHQELRWQFLFASDRLSRDPRTGRLHRHHLHKDTFPKRLRHAVDAAGLHKRVTSHTFRHCFASHLLWQGTDIRTIQHLLGHSDVATTEIYTHVRNPHESKVISPLDRLQAVA